MLSPHSNCMVVEFRDGFTISGQAVIIVMAFESQVNLLSLTFNIPVHHFFHRFLKLQLGTTQSCPSVKLCVLAKKMQFFTASMNFLFSGES